MTYSLTSFQSALQGNLRFLPSLKAWAGVEAEATRAYWGVP